MAPRRRCLPASWAITCASIFSAGPRLRKRLPACRCTERCRRPGSAVAAHDRPDRDACRAAGGATARRAPNRPDRSDGARSRGRREPVRHRSARWLDRARDARPAVSREGCDGVSRARHAIEGLRRCGRPRRRARAGRRLRLATRATASRRPRRPARLHRRSTVERIHARICWTRHAKGRSSWRFRRPHV